MTASAINPSAAASPQPDRSIAVRRICFVAGAPAGARVLREFSQPRRMAAVEVAADRAEVLGAGPGGPADSLEVVIVSPGPDGSATARTARPDRPEAEPPLSVKLKGGATIEWRPARAIIRLAEEDPEELLAALIDFGFLEGELRALEDLVGSRESQAEADVGRAHRVSSRDRAQWARIGETIESLARARLILARLEPMFANASTTLSPAGRRLMRRLAARSGAPARLAALSGRLEAIEDLYEGANDRIADYRGWQKGHVMEIIIIVLLLLEIFLMAGDMAMHYLEFQG